MKRIGLFLLLLAACGALCFSQQSVFVSALGSDENSGRSEEEPFRTMTRALAEIRESSVNRITIIGILDTGSETETGDDSVFTVALPVRVNELLITGSRNASWPARAVLTGRNSGLPVLGVNGQETRVRLENLEIIGGEGEDGIGLQVLKGGVVTLGPGVVVRDNQTGIKLTEGTCIIDGGEVRDNSAAGILVSDYSVLTIRDGSIRNNKSRGVFVQKGGRFSMFAGSITGNYDSTAGAGVYVQAGGRFDQTAGSINSNFSPQSPDIYREPGAFGNDLSMTALRPSTSDIPASSDTQDVSAGVKFNIPFFISIYGQAWRENLFSLGLVLQIGFEVDFGNALGIAVLGEADGGFGYPYIFEGKLLGVAEIYFAGKTIGLGGGYGIGSRTMHIDELISNSNSETDARLESIFYRFELIFHLPVKTTFFANYYDRGNWGNIENWAFGIHVVMNIFKRDRKK